MQDWTNSMLDDIFDDIVRGVIATSSLAFAAVVLQVDGAYWQGLVASILATSIFRYGKFLLKCLGVGNGFFGLFAFDDGHFYRGNTQFEFKQALIDAAKLAHAQAFIVDKGEVLAFLIEVAGHAVEAESKLTVGDFAVEQE